MNRVVRIARWPKAPATAAEAVGAPREASVLDRVLKSAGITESRTHCDSVCRAWDLNAGSSREIEVLVESTKVRKRVAAATRLLLRDLADALQLLWARPATSVLIELEDIALRQLGTPSSELDVRRRLLQLLVLEVQGDRPQQHLLAATAYMAIGHLGASEVDAAFGPTSSAKALLPLLDERFRRRVHAAGMLVGRRNAESVSKALDELCVEVTTALSEVRSQGGMRLTTNTPHALILKGGGAKGLAHVGALAEIRQYYICERFIGTSAGAIIAVLLGAGMSDSELEAELLGTDFSALVHEPWWICGMRLLVHGGLHTGHDLQDWLDNLLASKLESPTRVRLRQLRHTTVYACQGHDPTVTFDSQSPATMDEFATYAVRCSMSIPFYFTPGMKGGLHIFDGGLKQNYPVEALLKEQSNTPFIGLYLGIPIFEGKSKTGIVGSLLESLLEANDRAQLEKFQERTVIIDTRPIGTLKFKLSDDEKRFLYLAGRVAAIAFLRRQGVDLSDRTDIEGLSRDLNLLRDEITLAHTRRAMTRRRLAWGVTLMALVGWYAWPWEVWSRVAQLLVP